MIATLANGALAAKSPDARKRLYAKAQQIIVEECASCPMIFHPQIQAWRNRLVDYKGSYTFVAPIFNAHPGKQGGSSGCGWNDFLFLPIK